MNGGELEVSYNKKEAEERGAQSQEESLPDETGRCFRVITGASENQFSWLLS